MVFGTAISGLTAASQMLEVNGNNIANASTIGFKKSMANFVDLYSVSGYGGNTNIGTGTRLAAVSQSFGSGTTVSTTNSLDMQLIGGGFFILDTNGSRTYSRAGAFDVDKDGFIVNSLNPGQKVIGLTADNGAISTVTGPLQVDYANIPPAATTTMTTGVNLQSNSTPPAVDWVGGAVPAANTYNNKTSSTVYDSLGNNHTLTMYYILADSTALLGAPNAASPPGTQNQWYIAFQLDGQNLPANVGADNTSNLFRANFNTDGSFASVADVANVPIVGNQIPFAVALANGSAPLNFTMDLSNSTTFGSNFAAQSITQDGYTTGQLVGFEVSETGIIKGRYSNQKSRDMGQMQLANFMNLSGLTPTGQTQWGETDSSGQPIIGSPGTGSLGLIQSSSLEGSNVDLTRELVGLIEGQRNFQANAQTIRTADAITQTVINIR